MARILQINSSARAGGESSRLADAFVERWLAAHPEDVLVRRDVGREPLPHLDEATLGAFFTPSEGRDADQQARVALSDRLIEEVRAADILVLGVPMYNFTIPSTLKAWFDHIARAGLTFRYTETGPQGLLLGKRVYVFIARGGVYEGEADTQVPYLRQMLGFLGLTEVSFVLAQGLGMGGGVAEKARQAAFAQTIDLVAESGG
ncbi:MAG: FMN-dependent NADH-azoreductase [Pseudomonadota bacterium]